MNEAAKYFLPSLVRGVYRFDDRLSKLRNDDKRRFIKSKLDFLPKQFGAEIEKIVALESINPEKAIGEKLLTTGSHTQNKYRYQKYFEAYDYFQNQIEPTEGEQNYLEAEFVRKILSPLVTDDGLLRFQPQTPIGWFLADFTLETSQRYVFEVDGFGKFGSRQDLDRFNNRQNEITQDGWKVFRYTYSDIIENPSRTRRKIFDILKEDEEFRPFLLNPLGTRIRHQLFDLFEPKTIDVIDLVNDFFLVQDYCTAKLTSREESDAPIYIEDQLSYGFPMVAFALSDLYSFLETIEQLFDLRFDLNPIILVYKNFNKEFDKLLHPLIRIQGESETETDTIIVTSDELLTFSSPVAAPGLDEAPFKFSSELEVETISPHLCYLLESIFGFKETHRFQGRVLKKVVDRKDVIGISSTGSGKSFCFWLPALLKPGLSIVICPLRSLMRDQRLSLEGKGIASADFINSDVTSAEQIRIINDAKLGKLKLLYVAPERIRIKKFRDELESIQEFVTINYLIIDEAHCISEWGHDFRPSYLNIPSFYDQLKEKNSDVQLIAMTATAGQMVKRDIMNLLRLEDDNLVIEKDLDRPHFSYQIESIDGYTKKAETFTWVLTESIPTALSCYLGTSPDRVDIGKVVNSRSKEKKEKGIGIIYVVYADPHGKHSTVDGLAHYLRKTKEIIEPVTLKPYRVGRGVFVSNYSAEDFSTGKVRAFSSKAPTLCPICFSHRYITQQPIDDESDFEFDENIEMAEQQAGQKICLDCGHGFDANDAGQITNYKNATKENQDAFKGDELDVLVATKGFGMGIDKSSVRFVLHTSPSSSIESWYQEIGRAGRDEERAHCVAIADVPNERCLQELRQKKIPQCNWRTGCPYEKDGLCDYGKQHVFIKASYPGVVSDAISAVKTLDKLITSFIIEGHNGIVPFKSSNRSSKFDELALFRLSVLGMVEDFSVTYRGLAVDFEVLVRTEISQDEKITLWTDAEEIRGRLSDYLKKNELLPYANVPPIVDRITESKRKWDAEVRAKMGKLELQQYQSYPGFYHQIVDYLLVLLDHTYGQIVKMRYDMLWNLYKDVILNRDDCRRKPILDYFSGEGTFEPGYRCGLCDNCVKDLIFTLDTRNELKKTATQEELGRRLESAYELKTFDLDELRYLRDAFKDYPKSIYRRSRAILEGAPNNLVALYFTREFSPKDEEEANTLRLLETANRALGIDTVIRLYESSKPYLKAKILLRLNDEFGRFNNERGIRWLYQNVKEQHATNPSDALLRMGEILSLVVVSDWLEANYGDHLAEVKKKFREVYYG